jgi:hypothetical protein
VNGERGDGDEAGGGLQISCRWVERGRG